MMDVFFVNLVDQLLEGSGYANSKYINILAIVTAAAVSIFNVILLVQVIF